MHPNIKILAQYLDQAEALLLRYGQVQWADWLRKDARLIRALDFYGIEHLLAAYGGMGSFNDVVLQRNDSGTLARIDADDNENFDKLRGEIYSLARRLKSEEY